MPLALPPGAGKSFTYKFTGLLDFSKRRAELPLNNVTFAKTLNASGPWAASLSVEDLGIRRSSWQEATAVNRTAMWVDVGGGLLYGGRVTSRTYTESTGVLALAGGDFAGYTSQRLQAGDYTAYTDPEGHHWAASPGASALRIAYYMVKQALEKAYSIPIEVVSEGSIPGEEYWITFSAPEAQNQTLASLLSQLSELGYLIGVDYASYVEYDGGVPKATIRLGYPRLGSETPVVIDLANALELSYSEDGDEQANRVVAQGGALVDRSSGDLYLPSREAGYPLLEVEISQSALAPTETTGGALLKAFAEGALSVRAFPLTAPVVTLPMFGSPSIEELEVGQDVILRVPKVAGAQPLNNPRFPDGLEFTFRVTRIDCTVPDEGVATMALTLNAPPSTAPVEPPELDREAKEQKEKEELEAREEAQKEKEEEEKEAKEKLEEEEEEQTEKEVEEAEEAAEAAVTEAETALSEAVGERQTKEAEKVLKKAETVLAKVRKIKRPVGRVGLGKVKSEAARGKEEAEENKRESEIVKEAAGGISISNEVVNNPALEVPHTPSATATTFVTLSLCLGSGSSKYEIEVVLSGESEPITFARSQITPESGGIARNSSSASFFVKPGQSWTAVSSGAHTGETFIETALYQFIS